MNIHSPLATISDELILPHSGEHYRSLEERPCRLHLKWLQDRGTLQPHSYICWWRSGLMRCQFYDDPQFDERFPSKNNFCLFFAYYWVYSPVAFLQHLPGFWDSSFVPLMMISLRYIQIIYLAFEVKNLKMCKTGQPSEGKKTKISNIGFLFISFYFQRLIDRNSKMTNTW